MNRSVVLSILLILPACSLFDDSDPREGIEEIDACISRVTEDVGPQGRKLIGFMEGDWVPTYTYDITKMNLDAVKALMVEGSDETAGARLMVETNQESTAVAQFKNEPVTKAGSFFFARDPALYRVLGDPTSTQNMIAEGCKQQQADMRLISLSWQRHEPQPETKEISSADLDNENSE